jgi:ABC-type glycerol-3-phosphate transport system permease component
MAASVLFVLPPMAIFFLGQRVFVHGRIGTTGRPGMPP